MAKDTEKPNEGLEFEAVVVNPPYSVRYWNINKKLVLIIECERSNKACYLLKERFYVRTNPTTDELTGIKILE